MFSSISLSSFAERQYNPNFSGTIIFPELLNYLIASIKGSKYKSFSGYADFCKTLSVKNRNEEERLIFPNLQSLTVNRAEALASGGRIKTAYERRNEKEFPVLNEWVEGVNPKPAEFIYLVVYNREQMLKEGERSKFDWLIVSIQTGLSEEIEPMKPITAMRNALGVEYGGSGVVLNENEYLKSVSFWSENVVVRK